MKHFISVTLIALFVTVLSASTVVYAQTATPTQAPTASPTVPQGSPNTGYGQ